MKVLIRTIGLAIGLVVFVMGLSACWSPVLTGPSAGSEVQVKFSEATRQSMNAGSFHTALANVRAGNDNIVYCYGELDGAASAFDAQGNADFPAWWIHSGLLVTAGSCQYALDHASASFVSRDPWDHGEILGVA